MAVERWTDEMLDELTSDVKELTSTVNELSSDVKELTSTVHEVSSTVNELSSTVNEVSDSVDGLRITAQALLQIAAQSQQDMELMKQRQAESDQRFNVLLEEVRFLIRGNRDNQEN
jgi:outer membrane murein-binding lipoprotein Lpp